MNFNISLFIFHTKSYIPDKFIVEQKGENYDNTYPYAWAGESKKNTFVRKIKKYNMKLSG